MALTSDVNPCGLGEAAEIDAAMFEEAAVFDGQNRTDHDSGDFVVVDHLALGTLIAFEK